MSLTWQPLLAWHDLGLSHGVAPQAYLYGWVCEEKGKWVLECFTSETARLNPVHT